jgi:hypothetical protein
VVLVRILMSKSGFEDEDTSKNVRKSLHLCSCFIRENIRSLQVAYVYQSNLENIISCR